MVSANRVIFNPGIINNQIEIDVQDNMTPYLRQMQEQQPIFMRKATKSLGWWMQKQIKDGIRSGAPGGSTYQPTNIPMRRMLEGGKRGNFKALGKLVNAVGYQYLNGNLLVGWLSRSSVFFGSIQEKGKQISVSEKMKRWFYHHDVIIQKSTVDIPARPTFDPMFKVLAPKAVPYLEEKILSYWQNPPNQASAKRRYRVRG